MEDRHSWKLVEPNAPLVAAAEPLGDPGAGEVEVGREVDFIELRRRLARGKEWSDELGEAIPPQSREAAT